MREVAGEGGSYGSVDEEGSSIMNNNEAGTHRPVSDPILRNSTPGVGRRLDIRGLIPAKEILWLAASRPISAHFLRHFGRQWIL